jgi:hypothetical protein
MASARDRASVSAIGAGLGWGGEFTDEGFGGG